MKRKSMKRVFAVTLATATFMAFTLTAAASSGASSGESSGASTGAAAAVEESSAAESSDGSVVEAVIPEYVQMLGTNANVVVGGKVVRTSVAGTYASRTLNGAAVITPIDEVKSELGLSKGQEPHIMLFDTDPQKSPLAMNCVNAAAEALGGNVVATINVELSAKQNGKLTTLSDGEIKLVAGLPKGADTSKAYSVICVQPGGLTTILADQDSSAETITFSVKAGLATYAIVGR